MYPSVQKRKEKYESITRRNIFSIIVNHISVTRIVIITDTQRIIRIINRTKRFK